MKSRIKCSTSIFIGRESTMKKTNWKEENLSGTVNDDGDDNGWNKI